MRKVIKIFLASSIVEFSNERMAIENFIRNISDRFEENYDVKLLPLLCENFDDAFSITRKQEEYNEKIRDSELCFFIFFTKAGEYTREEFEVARKKFEETGKPKIYTYFKVIKDEQAEQSLYDFMEELDKVFGHYYGTFDHVDTIKLRILLSLKLQELDFIEIKADDGNCVVDGKPAMSLSNVSEFANNQVFKELKAEFSEVEEKYFRLKAKYESDECSSDEYREYAGIATKRQNLIDAIEELQKNIFNMSLRMCKDEARGEITVRQKEAYRLFEAGDIEGANRILDFTEIKSEYERRKAIRKAEQKKDAQIFIRETKTKIDMLEMLTKIVNRFGEMEELYDKISAEAFEFGVELSTVRDFVWFLYRQNKHQKAYNTAKQLEEIYNLQGDKADEVKLAEIYHDIAAVCSDIPSKKDESEEYYVKAIEIREKLAATNPERVNSNLADSYNNAGIFYQDQGQPGKAEEYYLKAIEIREKLAAINPERFNSDLAGSYNNAGIFYKDQGQPGKAEEYFLKAIEIYEKLAAINPERFNSDLAGSYNNAGNFYQDRGQPGKAEEYFLKAIEIYEKLAATNPERFNPDLAVSYNSAGVFYKNQGQPEKAEEYYLKAIEIREKLAAINPERFVSDLAMSYSNAGVFYAEQRRPEKAEEYYLKAIEIREKLAAINPERFVSDLADSYNNAGVFYAEQRRPEKAEEYFLRAIEIREKLAAINPERFNSDLADSYNNAGIFYKNQGQQGKAEEYFLKAIEIYEKLAATNPERFNPDLAVSYNNAGVFYAEQRRPEKAEEYFLRAIEIREKLAAINPERFNSDLAVSYNNAGVFYQDRGQQGKAEEYYLKAIEIREKLAAINPERFVPDLAVSYFNFAIFSKDNTYFKKALELAKTRPENPYCRKIISALGE